MRLKDRSRRPAMDMQRAEAVALQGLAFLVEDTQRLVRFLTTTGIEPHTLQLQTDDPTLLRGVLEHLLADESGLLVFTAGNGLTPEQVTAAHAVIAGSHGREWND